MLPTSLNKPNEYKIQAPIEGDVDVASVYEHDTQTDNEEEDDTLYDVDMQDIQNKEPKAQSSAPEYTYRALETLTKNVGVGELTDVDNIVICPYTIDTDGVLPFLKFGLINDGISLNFITLPCSQSIDLDRLPNFRGHLLQDRTLYFFFEYRPSNASMFLFMFPIQHFVLVDEIMNHQMVCRTPISISVLDFFTRNSQFLYLENSKGEFSETPVVGYYGTFTENVNLLSTFGVPCALNTEMMGPNYYFTDYINAIKNAIQPTKEQLANDEFKQYLTPDNKYKHGSVLRFAIFLGKTKVILNRPTDPIDESQMKQYLLNNDDTSRMARLTMRVTDHDGNWTKEYDSTYIGRIDLDDGSKLMNGPLWVVHNYNQQVFLSSNKIDHQKSLFL